MKPIITTSRLNIIGIITGGIIFSVSFMVLIVGREIYGSDAALLWGMGLVTYPALGMIVNVIKYAFDKNKETKQ